VRLYDRLFGVQNPGAGERDFLLDLNPGSRKLVAAWVEDSLSREALARTSTHEVDGGRFQFERHGYFAIDRGGFNRTVTLRDAWR